MQLVHQQEVMSEGDGYRILGEMQRDHVVSQKAKATFDNQVTSHIDEDGKVVIDSVVTILYIQESEGSNVVRSKKA